MYGQQLNHLAQAQLQALKLLIESQQSFKLTVDDALKYLDLVKSKLGSDQFEEFMSIMREVKETNCDCMVTISKMCQLLQGYPELLQGFGTFLPPSFNVQLQTAGRFLFKNEPVENAFSCVKSEISDRYEVIDWQEKRETSVLEDDVTLDDAQDINGSEKSSTMSKEVGGGSAIMFLSKVKERFQNEPNKYQKFLQLLDSFKSRVFRKDSLDETDLETDVYIEVCDLFQDNGDLIEEFKTFVPHASLPNQNDNEDSLPFSDSSEELPRISSVNDPSIAPVGKYGSFHEHLFFDKVRQALYHKEVYDNFLRCLMLYNEDVVTRSELLKMATSFLGKFPDLLKQFKDILRFNESGENIELVPMKIIAYENSRLDPELSLDIDYATGGRNGASYRALQKDLKQPKCSGRTPLCKEVLNDIWVSFPSWSEDSTFVTSCKTQYEEMIYRCEDERFELDMAIRSNSYTLQALENVQKKINKMTPEEKSMFSLDDTLGGTSTVLHQKALHRLYGDKTDELVEGLKRNPIVAVPIILKRLKGKDEEWKEKQKTFNAVWREQIDNYYIKSLDHQGINFKQNDSKSFRSKSLLNEMDMVYAEKKENQNFNHSAPHFLLEFEQTSVFLDAINLICLYLKKLPGILREDRRRIELLIRNFIPDFFCFPRATIVEEEIVEEEEEENNIEAVDLENENDNDNEGSGQTSPCESGPVEKDEEFSDADESNSVEENEMSDDTDKNSFIEDSDIFDKLDVLQPTNLPYILFFINKTWYVFFRQFHILCERLARLLHESKRKDCASPVKTEEGSEDIEKDKPSYEELIAKLSQLLSGAMDYNQFEDEARSLFGIHAFVSFTMDKLVLNIVRQLQQIIGDDLCKQCTAFFYQHNKTLVNGNFSSPLESLHVENEYLKKVEKIMNEEKCFKILWHKKSHTLTIELIEHEEEIVDDPCEVEKWSNYVDCYVTEDSVSEDILAEATGLPVFLPRNLRRQQEYWKTKVRHVEHLWNSRYSPTFLKKNPPINLRKRKVDFLTYRKTKQSKYKGEGSTSVCSEISNPKEADLHASDDHSISHSSEPSTNVGSEEITLTEKTESSQLAEPKDENSTSFFMNVDADEEAKNCCSVDDSQEVEIKSEDTSLEKSCAGSDICYSSIGENFEFFKEDSMDIDCNSNCSVVSSEKRTSVHHNSEENIYSKSSEDQIDSVAAFHDVMEDDSQTDVIIETKPEIESTVIETVTVMDSEDDKTNEDEAEKVKDDVKVSPKSNLQSKKQTPVRKYFEYSTRTRRNRALHEYVKKRSKKSHGKSFKDKKKSKKQDEFDDVTFDFNYFSELSEDDKCSFLAMRSLIIEDNTEGTFKRENLKLVFVQYCDLFLCRQNCLTRAKEIHQQVSEIKTSNFNAWHRIWLDRYVTPAMLKFCSDWFLRSSPEKFKLVCVTMSDCTKPPYMPYSKYRVRYYKTDSS